MHFRPMSIGFFTNSLQNASYTGGGRYFERTVTWANLNAGFAEVHPPGQVFPHEGVRVVSALENLLEGAQLRGRERRAVPALLLPPVAAADQAHLLFLLTCNPWHFVSRDTTWKGFILAYRIRFPITRDQPARHN